MVLADKPDPDAFAPYSLNYFESHKTENAPEQIDLFENFPAKRDVEKEPVKPAPVHDPYEQEVVAPEPTYVPTPEPSYEPAPEPAYAPAPAPSYAPAPDPTL